MEYTVNTKGVISDEKGKRMSKIMEISGNKRETNGSIYWDKFLFVITLSVKSNIYIFMFEK